MTVFARFGDVIKHRQHEMMTSSEREFLDLLDTTADSSSTIAWEKQDLESTSILYEIYLIKWIHFYSLWIVFLNASQCFGFSSRSLGHVMFTFAGNAQRVKIYSLQCENWIQYHFSRLNKLVAWVICVSNTKVPCGLTKTLLKRLHCLIPYRLFVC